MTRKYFPGCKIKARYPEASAWLEEQVLERGYADIVEGCCRTNHQNFTEDDTAVCICNNCMAMIDEEADNGSMDNIWILIDNDPGFPLPDWSAKTMGIQDCGRAFDREDVQDAIRSLLQKMNINVIELPDAREKSIFCGTSFLMNAPEQDLGFAPKRYGELAHERGYFTGEDPDTYHDKMIEHCSRIEPDEVVCYCTACDAGLEDGGKDAINIIELVSGKFRN